MPWPYALAHAVFRGEALLPPSSDPEDELDWKAGRLWPTMASSIEPAEIEAESPSGKFGFMARHLQQVA
jgi:hypothetical protein